MSARIRFLFLALIMISACAMVMAVITVMLYRHDIHQHRELLQVTAQSQARLIEAVARYDARIADDNPSHDASAATLSQIIDSHERYEGFGETGEFTLARREGDSIVFVLRHRHGAVEQPVPVAFDSDLAEPMRRALGGLSGTVIGLDYRGETVLAAHEPVAVLNMGIVAKIDLREIREPFIRAGLSAASVAFLVVFVGSVMFFRVSNPLITRLENTRRLEKEVKERKQAEEALQESERHLEQAQAMAHIGHWRLNPETGEISGSDEFFRVFGLSRGETRLDAWVDAVHPDDREYDLHHVRRGLDRGESWNIEHRVVWKDGTEKIVNAIGKAITDETGKTVLLLGTVQDITERKQAEEALRESEAKYRTFFENSVDAMLMIRDYMFIDCNAATVAMLGYENKKELLNTHPSELSPEFQPDGKNSYDKAVEMMDIALAKGTHRFEWDHKRKNGEMFPVEVSLTAIPQDEGMILHTVWLDLTERKRAEEALRESADLNEKIISESPIGILIYNADGQCVAANDSVGRLIGATKEQMLAQNYNAIASWQKFGLLDAAKEAVREGTTQRGVFHVTSTFGKHFYCECHCVPFVREGAVHLMVMFVDLTEREQAEEEREKLEAQLRQAQKMEAVGQLAGGVAHDFNNLLQAIMGYGDLALESAEADSPVRASVEEILKASERATTLVSQLLAFSRRQVLDMRDVDLNDVVANIMKMIQRLIGEHISLEILAGRDLGIVRADPGQIEQILINLCVNSRDAMPEGGTITIETENVRVDEAFCETHTWAVPGRYALLTVTDTGCGIDEQTLGHVFDPFFTTKGVGDGTGLGLATVYGLVKQHQGMIDVYSEIDKGTTFKIYLPLVERSAAVVGDKIEGPVVGGTETILLAEDEEVVRTLTKTILEREGYKVLSACDGEEALRVFEEHSGEIDLALLDVIMPKLGGSAVYERIHEKRAKVSVLFCSGYSMNAIHTNFVLDEGLALIQKPYQRANLLRKIREVLDS